VTIRLVSVRTIFARNFIALTSDSVAGLMKLFIHEILPESVKKVIFVDTDAIQWEGAHISLYITPAFIQVRTAVTLITTLKSGTTPLGSAAA
jgi:hypothetical protein